MSDYLPIDILKQVFLRLHIKTLLRCSSISKTWYNLITSTDFISAHLDFTKSLPNSTHLKLFVEDYSTQKIGVCNYFYVLYSDDKLDTFEEYTKFEFNDENSIQSSPLRVSGSCNGLICLASMGWPDPYFHAEKVVLWNPAIRRSLELPMSYGHCDRDDASHRVFGFVFDHIGKDYKVLRIRNQGHGGHYMVEVFRLSTGLWKDISIKAFRWLSPSSFQADLKGIPHWIGKKNYGNDYELKIISFDVHEEVFGSIELPFDVVNHDRNHENLETYLFVFEESLILIRQVGDAYDKKKCKFDVWRMGEYNVVESWNRLQTWVFDQYVNPLCFKKNGEIVWLAKKRKLMSTTLKDSSVNYLGAIYHSSCLYGICQHGIYHPSCLYYAESLILLDKSLSSASEDQKLKGMQWRS